MAWVTARIHPPEMLKFSETRPIYVGDFSISSWITKLNRMRIGTCSLQDYSLFTGNNIDKSAWVKVQYPFELLRSSETLTMLGIYRWFHNNSMRFLSKASSWGIRIKKGAWIKTRIRAWNVKVFRNTPYVGDLYICSWITI